MHLFPITHSSSTVHHSHKSDESKNMIENNPVQETSASLQSKANLGLPENINQNISCIDIGLSAFIHSSILSL